MGYNPIEVSQAARQATRAIEKNSGGGSGLAVVEFTTVIGSGDFLTAAECEALTEAAANCMPIIIKCPSLVTGELATAGMLFHYIGNAFAASIGTAVFQLAPLNDGTWALIMK